MALVLYELSPVPKDWIVREAPKGVTKYHKTVNISLTKKCACSST